MTKNAVEIVDVTKRFGEVVAVNHVTLSIKENEFFSLLGPSGCGKTTTLRIIAGLEDPDEGTVKLRGKIVNDLPPYRRNVGMVFQNLALFPHMTVFDNIAFGLKMRKVPKAEIKRRVMEMLRITRMEGLENRKIHQLSGGQQQRVAIARALIIEPDVLLLDEPLGALDLKIRLAMQVELKRIQREVGTTFVYVTHDQGEALSMSDRIAVMKDGKVQQIGTPMEIYERPKTRFVADFIGEANLIEGKCTAPGVFESNLLPTSVKVVEEPEFVGKKVFLSVRPERIAVGEEAKKLENQMEGTVESYIYQGSAVLIHVRIDDKTLMKVRVPATSEVVNILESGKPITIGWKKENGILVLP